MPLLRRDHTEETVKLDARSRDALVPRDTGREIMRAERVPDDY